LCKVKTIESIITKQNKMLTQLRHKRFIMMDELSSLSCHWYAMEQRSIVPTGDENDDNLKRPDCIYT
jgi:hypothetical protein